MKWITLLDGTSLNMAQATQVEWGKNEKGERYAEVFLAGGNYAIIHDLDAVEQLGSWMIDNSEVIE